jgi:hypothetical protein
MRTLVLTSKLTRGAWRAVSLRRAIPQNNLGTALGMLGERESGDGSTRGAGRG